MITDISSDDRPRADDGILSNLDLREHDGAGADHRSLANAHLSAYYRCGANGHVVAEADMVSDGGTSIDEHEAAEFTRRPETAAGIDVQTRLVPQIMRDGHRRIDEAERVMEAERLRFARRPLAMARCEQGHHETKLAKCTGNLPNMDQQSRLGQETAGRTVRNARNQLNSGAMQTLFDIHHERGARGKDHDARQCRMPRFIA